LYHFGSTPFISPPVGFLWFVTSRLYAIYIAAGEIFTICDISALSNLYRRDGTFTIRDIPALCNLYFHGGYSWLMAIIIVVLALRDLYHRHERFMILFICCPTAWLYVIDITADAFAIQYV
jgi:hypothetical protein